MLKWSYILFLSIIPHLLSTQSIGDLLSNYTSQFHFEKIYVHTDKEYYLPEETIYGKIYHVHGQDHQFIDTSIIVHIELWSPEGILTEQLKLKTVDGMNSFSIHTDLNFDPGIYHLKAYTQYQKNFDPEYIFQKELSVVYTPKDINTTTQDTIDSILVNFYPEGGYLIDDIKSKVAFRSVNQRGEPIDIKGTIIDDSGSSVSDIQTTLNGYGYFELSPNIDKDYTFVTEHNGDTVTFNLPQPIQDGAVFSVTYEKEYIEVKCRLSDALKHKSNTLIAHVRGQILLEYSFDQDTKFKLIPSELPSGIVHLTIFDDQTKPLAERLVYVYNPNDKIELDFDLSERNTHHQINSSISFTDLIDTALINASISIYCNDLFEYKPRGIAINSYLLVQSDLKGRIDRIHDFYIEDEQGNNQLDLIMMTHGWRKFNWLEVLEKKKRLINYPPEFSTLVAGQIKQLRNNKPIKADVMLTTLSKNLFTSQNITTEKDGLFVFSGLELSDTTELIIQAAKHKEKRKKENNKATLSGNRLVNIDLIELNTPEINFNISIPTSNFIPSSKRKNELQDQNLGAEQKQPSNSSTVFENSLWSIDLEDFVVKTSKLNKGQRKNKITKKAYRERNMVFFSSTEKFDPNEEQFQSFEFKTIHQMISQVIPTAKLIYRDGYAKIIYGRLSNQTEVTLILDGERLTPDRAFNLDPNNIAMIDVWTGLRATMVYDADPVIVLLSKNPDQIKSSPVKGLVNLSYPAYHQAKTFSYDEPFSWTTDYIDKRTTLYWNPNVQLSPDSPFTFSFYSSDLSGQFIMDIQGISTEGKPQNYYFPFVLEQKE